MKIKIAILLSLLSNAIFAQTNTFPATGAVGIGTVSPTNRLEVFGNSFNRISATVGADVQTGFQAKKTGTNATDWEFYIPVASTDFRFYRAGVGDVVTLRSNGFVGIGTTSPATKLQVHGTIMSNTQSNTIDPDDNVSNNFQGYAGYWALRTAANNSFNLDVYNSDSPITAFNVVQNGNVGIGTTSPAAKLQVHGTIMSNARSNTLDPDDNVSNNFQGYAGYWSLRTATNNSFNLDVYNLGLPITAFNVAQNGNVGIGTTNPNQKLTVNGTIYGKEVKVDLNVPGPDYVFADNYQLQPLNELKTYIDQNKHLPEVPSAAAMEANGINLGEMNMLLLKKVEELTLHLIEMKREIKDLRSTSEAQENTIKELQNND